MIKKTLQLSYTDKWDKRISWAIMWSFTAPTINWIIKTSFVISGGLWSLVSLITGASILLAWLLCLKEILRRSGKLLLISYAIFILLYTWSILLCTLREEGINLVIESAIMTFLKYLPVGVYIVSVYNKKILYDTIIKYSNITFVLLLFRVLTNFGIIHSEKEAIEYSMSFGYIIILPTLLHLNEFYNTKKRLYLFLAILEIIAIIVWASRGVLLSLGAFFLYKTLVSNNNIISKILTITLIIIIGLIISIYGNQILINSINTLEKVGIESRTLNMIESNNIDNDSGRYNLFRISYDMITMKPLLGWGLGGEYYQIAKEINQSIPDMGCTSHNGILQVMVQFGLIGGIIISLLVIIPIFGVNRIKNFYSKNIIEIYYCAYAIPALTISSGFFIQPAIAIFIFMFYFGNNLNNH